MIAVLKHRQILADKTTLNQKKIQGQTTVEFILLTAMVVGIALLFVNNTNEKMADVLGMQKQHIENISIHGGYDSKKPYDKAGNFNVGRQ